MPCEIFKQQSCSRPLKLKFISIFFLFLLISCRAEDNTPARSTVKLLNKYLDSTHLSPADKIALEIGGGRSVILVQENPLRSDTMELVQALVPMLHSMGFRQLGMYQFSSGGQMYLDRYSQDLNVLITNEELFSFPLAALYFKEYRDFLNYIRRFNALLEEHETAFEIIGLGGSEGVSRALDILDNGNGFLWLSPEMLAQVFKAPDSQNPSGNSISPLILRHYGPGENALLWNGLVEHVKAQRPLRDRSFAYKPDELPFQLWQDTGIKADLVVVTEFTYKAVHIMPKFITESTKEEALNSYPSLNVRKPEKISPRRINRIIKRQVKHYEKFLSKVSWQ
ncbi:MAG: hypothetical protein B0D92_07815 [Spirochaeta sp. LUC14_002_19_P3]|nr:MAG: hypothetical protein B0D92_07815 [Spirochaeta sp. LUC14_002_19_P3]